MMDADWRGVVEADRVRARAYTDPAIFETEMARVFDGAWVYVGHDSQVPAPGDLYATRLGRHPVVLVRAPDGAVRVLHNRCPHRGAQIVADGFGHARVLRCAYHGWTFALDGSLRTAPLAGGYEGSGFGPGCAGTDMAPVRAAQYRGFVFANLSGDAPPLIDWLGGVASSIDNMADRAPEGRLEVAGGVLRYLHEANWKFFVENLNDLMHPMVAHQSSSGTARQVARAEGLDAASAPFALQALSPFTSDYAFFDAMGVTVFPHGHSFSGGEVSIHSAYTGVEAYDRAMDAAYGTERARAILSVNRHNTVVYPSLTLKGAIQTLRVIRPLAVDRTLIESWCFRLVGAPDELLYRTIEYCNLINSHANLVGPDDHEAYRRLQAGLNGGGLEWVSHHRHPGEGTPAPEGGAAALGTSDLVFRNQYRAWTVAMRRGT